MQSDKLREKFLSFFKARKHKIVEPDSLVPRDDPTILFTPAGMNQFKKEFLGFDSGFTRAATCQRCLRTDDLDKVGKTPGHHTFFEMLGNFSFGDYFKKEAITWAWEFLTQELKIKEEKLWVSVYRDDDEAYKIWHDLVKVPAGKIIRLGDKENFWPAEAKTKGPNGPCGPCSEIFFDLGSNIGCKKADCTPACDCGRFIEVWNLVFTQFNRKEGGVLEPLPNKNIDTGMGLERLVAVIQDAPNNFETDLFKEITKEIASAAKSSPNRQTINAIADHIRAIVFAIYDGAMPANEDRGYVIRKLIRKSMLHLQWLGIKKPFLYKLVPVLTEIMKAPYPELENRKENISEIILAEEKNALSIWKSSDILMKEKFKGFNSNSDSVEVGKIAFQLYDTYGMPLEVIKDWLKNLKIPISEEAFNKELINQKTRSRSQSTMKGEVFSSLQLGHDLKETKFLGYKECLTNSKVLKIIKGSQEVSKVVESEEAALILDKTPFYAEAGGQVGDTGELVKGKNKFEVLDTKKLGKAILHIGKVKAGGFKRGDFINAQVNCERRLSIARNHTATHLLQAALRKVLGPHVQQQGSLVAEDRLRFDFTHFKDINQEELSRIEEIVNNSIINNLKVDCKEKTLTEAKKSGALAFFGEKYENRVRVVTINDLSKELCGGTHLEFTGQIGRFKIVQEGSVASGIRRIEAVTGIFADQLIKKEEGIITDLSGLLGVPVERILPELEKRISRLKELEKRLSKEIWDKAKETIAEKVHSEVIDGKNIFLGSWDNLDMALLRKAVDTIKLKNNNAIIALGANNQGKALLVVGVTPDLCEKGVDATKLILEPAKIIGGNGGGRADFAQAGGNNPLAFAQAFAKLKDIIRGLK